MTDPLAFYKHALEALCGRPPFVLPYPYKRGHFRTGSADLSGAPAGLTVVQRENCLFWTLSDRALLCAVSQLAAEKPEMEPSSGPHHTLLKQIYISEKSFQGEDDLSEKQRFLLRTVLDLPRLSEKKKADRELVRSCLRLLDEEFAQSLAQGGATPALKICAAACASFPHLLDLP